jgi:hypothetical protein
VVGNNLATAPVRQPDSALTNLHDDDAADRDSRPVGADDRSALRKAITDNALGVRQYVDTEVSRDGLAREASFKERLEEIETQRRHPESGSVDDQPVRPQGRPVRGHYDQTLSGPARCPGALRVGHGGLKMSSPFAPTSHLPGASTTSPSFRKEMPVATATHEVERTLKVHTHARADE